MKSKPSRKRKETAKKRQRPAGQDARQPVEDSRRHWFPVVGIGASAGGFESFVELLRGLPAPQGMAFVLVQHLDPTHGSMLPDILGRAVKMPVSEVTDGVMVEPNHVYVIPPNTTMAMKAGVLRLGARVLSKGQHMPVDSFFHSLADERGNQAIGVILSGTASDGTEGCRAIKAAGGITFAQDEASAKFSGMPRSAVASGCVDFVMQPRQIAEELVRIVNHPYVARVPVQEQTAALAGRDLDELLKMVGERSGVDFSLYKQTTLQRRIARRMVVHRLEKLRDYVRYVKDNPGELDELYRDILIHVTGFFRDPEAFEALRAAIFPALLKQRDLDDSPLRIWVPGCSTGEEVYSIGMMLIEYLSEKHGNPSRLLGSKVVQIFATDISGAALDRARTGFYSAAAVADVSPERLLRFFMKADGGYQVIKAVREMCIFARQNVTRDPPFSNLDLISCRNLLIYLGAPLQKRVIPVFHYALKQNGYLFLGASESLTTFTDHFVLIDKKQKIYQKKATAARLIGYFTGPPQMPRRPPEGLPKHVSPQPPLEKTAERILMNRFVPPSIVVNEDMEVLHVRGRTGRYLELAEGHHSASLSRMAREGLMVDLHAAMNKAKLTDAPVLVQGVQVKSDGGTTEVNLNVVPLNVEGSGSKFYMIVFDETPSLRAANNRRQPTKTTRAHGAAKRELERLRRESTELKQQLQLVLEDHETTTEEFKSANEEVLSANEELQSTNEELETAKEELQSGNEELTTLNEELHNRNAELSMANSDLLNLLANVNIALAMVDSDLRVRRFTPPAEGLLNLIPADVGRRIGDIRPNIAFDDLDKVVREVMRTGTVQQHEVTTDDGKWFWLWVRPYKTGNNQIDGAVISLQDIDKLKRTLDATREYTNALIENAGEPILMLDRNLRVTAANEAFYRAFAVSPGETEGRLVQELGSGQWNIIGLKDLLEKITSENTRVENFEVQRQFPNLGRRRMRLNARRIMSPSGTQLILFTIQDITERENHLAEISTQSALIEMAHETVIVRDFEGTIRFWNRGAEQMYGWTKEEALGKRKQDLLRPVFPKPLDAINKDLLSTGYWEGELVHLCKDGTRKVMQSRWAVREEEAGKPMVLEINTDVTDRVRSENSLRQLSAYLMQLQDEERRRIARDLHDSTGQKLVALKMNLSAIEKAVVADGKSKSMVTDSLRLVDDATGEIRTLSHMLHPPLLDEVGLISATKWLVDGFRKRTGMKLDLQADEELGQLPENTEIALFRVVQESLNNIYRHSEATRARIELARKDHEIRLKIRDNGKGMPPALVSAKSEPRLGVGILGMRERLAQLGGRLDISSGPGGTTVTAVVPVAASGVQQALKREPA